MTRTEQPNSQETAQPWLAEGGSRRTWFYRRKGADGASSAIALQGEAALRGRVAELEVLLAMPGRKVWQLLCEAVAREKATKANAKKLARDELSAEFKALKAEVARLKSDPDNAAAERIAALERQLKGERTKNANLRIDAKILAHKSALVLSKTELATLRRVHPDAKDNETALNKAAALLNALIDEGRMVVEGEA
jgi:hypothetical protein